MKPDFLCIGAQKAGTSWLYARLSDNPEFSMPPVKELHYFDRSLVYPTPSILSESSCLRRVCSLGYVKKAIGQVLRSRGVVGESRVSWWLHYYFGHYGDKWYISLFSKELGITGDVTPGYAILKDEDLAKMHSVIPNAKLIFLLRNPIERAWSAYRYSANYGRKISCYDFESFKEFVDSPNQVDRSAYMRTIGKYLKFYDDSQMLIGFFDAIIEQPDFLLSSILSFLGAGTLDHQTDLREINNKSKHLEIPSDYSNYLKEKYESDLEELSVRFGGYATKWYSALSRQSKLGENFNPECPPVVNL